jgi:hypothetical protein
VTSSEPQSPEESGVKPPSTQEIPVVQPAAGATATQQLPPHPGATTQSPVQAVDSVVPTGPVDFVPGLRGAGTPPPQPPVRPAPVADGPATAPAAAAAAGAAPEPTPGRTWPETLESRSASEDRPRRRRARPSGIRAPRGPANLLGIGLTVLSLVLLELGLTMRGENADTYWESIPLWSAFASACALLGLGAYVAFVAAGNRLRAGGLWRIAAAGLVGLAVFWLLVVLPVVATDRGFVLTAALGALGGALWAGPRGKD